MRLIPFTNADDLNRRLSKASEQHLPEDERRQAIAHVEQIMWRELTADERTRFAQVAAVAPQMVPGDDPAELRPVRRLSFSERSHVAIGIRGSDQGRSGAELEEDADALLLVIGLGFAVLVGIGAAELIVRLADAAGALFLS